MTTDEKLAGEGTATQQIVRLQAELAAANQRIKCYLGENKICADEVAELESELAEANAELPSEKWAKLVDLQEQKVIELQEAIQSRDNQLLAAHRRIDEQNKQLATAKAENASLIPCDECGGLFPADKIEDNVCLYCESAGERIRDCDDEIEKLEKQLANARSAYTVDVGKLRKELAAAKYAQATQIAELKKELNDAQCDSHELGCDLDRVRKKLATAKAECEEADQTLQFQLEESDKIRAELAEAKSCTTMLDSIDRWKTEAGRWREKAAKLEQQLANATTVDCCSLYHIELDRLKAELAKAVQATAEEGTKRGRAEAKICRLEKLLDTTRTERDRYYFELRESRTELATERNRK